MLQGNVPHNVAHLPQRVMEMQPKCEQVMGDFLREKTSKSALSIFELYFLRNTQLFANLGGVTSQLTAKNMKYGT